MSRDFDIELPRDGHYREGWHITDSAGADLDLTGHTISAVAQLTAGPFGNIAAATIDPYDLAHGRFTMTWAGSDFAGVTGPTQAVRVSWKLRDIAPGGIAKDIVRGHIILIPENS